MCVLIAIHLSYELTNNKAPEHYSKYVKINSIYNCSRCIEINVVKMVELA